jgi:four helix bundle protein
VTREITNFKDLNVWQRAMALTKLTYHHTKHFPSDERYGLVSQMQRAAVSIPSNIAEGFNRHSTKEYKQFLSVALGSAGELETQYLLAESLGYLDVSKLPEIVEELDAVSRMLRALIAKLDVRIAS